MSLDNRELEALIERGLQELDAGEDELLVALSGGLDSLALAALLHDASLKGGPRIVIAHIDHNLREGSHLDACRARTFADQLGLPFFQIRLTHRKGGQNQSRLRLRRYGALAEIALRQGISTVATAHHCDDEIENFLLQARRGTGLRGVAASAILSTYPLPLSLSLFRPLLEVPKEVLRSFLIHRNLDWAEDPTNQERKYDRNRLRHDLIPSLVPTPGSRESLYRTMGNLKMDSDYLHGEAQKLLQKSRIPCVEVRTLAFCRATLRQAPGVLRRRVFLALLPHLDAKHLVAIDDLLESEESKILTLPAFSLTMDRDRLFLEPYVQRGAKELLQRRFAPLTLDLSNPGSLVFLGDHHFQWSLLATSEAKQVRLQEKRSFYPSPSATVWSEDFLVPLSQTEEKEFRKPSLEVRTSETGPKRSAFSYRAPRTNRQKRRWPQLFCKEKGLLWIPGVKRESPENSKESDATEVPFLRITWTYLGHLTEIIHS